jgi:hypothetical protein
LNDVHTVSVGRAFLDLHCLTTYDAVQQIDEGAFVVVGIVLAVPHFFAFSPSSTMRMLRHSHIAGFRLPIASAGGFESQPLANFDSVRIYSRSLQLVDVQKHIRTTGVVCNKSEASVGIPHFQFPGAHPIFPFSARAL